MPALLRSLLLGALLLLAGCAQLPARPQLPYQAALPVAEGTRLDAEVAPAVARHPGASGFRLVADGMEAFALRGHSARSAGRSLDIQTYIWHDDLTGRLLAAEVLDAADRGVQVRVLLDDLDARAKSQALLALDSHPRISIRIFNPLATRDGMLGTALEFASDFERVNRRAHNKSWIVDGRLAVAGGRNLGDEYFMASPEANFQDLDLLVAGPAVAALADAFDSYWNSESAWPIRALEPRKPQGEALQAVRESLRQSTSDAGKEAWVQALGEPDALARIRVGHLGMRWTQQWQLLQDAPDKLVQQVQPIAGTDASPILAGLRSAMQSSQREIAIISPYFVPGEEGANSLGNEAQPRPRAGQPARLLRRAPAWQGRDIRPPDPVRRIAQPRSALRAAQFRAGPAGHRRGPRGPAVGDVRQHDPPRERLVDRLGPCPWPGVLERWKRHPRSRARSRAVAARGRPAGLLAAGRPAALINPPARRSPASPRSAAAAPPPPRSTP